MNTKFCVNCGEVNLVEANVCRRCGMIWGQGGKNPFYSQNEQPKTAAQAHHQLNQVQTGQAAQPKVKSGSSKIFWILGVAGTLVFLIGGIFVVAAFGIYLYTNRTNTIYTDKYPKPSENPTEKPNPVNSNPKSNSSLITNETIKEFFRNKKKVGKFELLKVQESRPTGFFPDAEAEADALYSVPGKKEDVLIDMATYPSKEKARNGFIEMLKVEKKAGSRMIGEINEDEKTIGASFQHGKVFVLAFCNYRVDTVTVCYQINSFKRGTVVDFYESFIKK